MKVKVTQTDIKMLSLVVPIIRLGLIEISEKMSVYKPTSELFVWLVGWWSFLFLLLWVFLSTKSQTHGSDPRIVNGPDKMSMSFITLAWHVSTEYQISSSTL